MQASVSGGGTTVSSPSPTRTLTLWESQYNAARLFRDHWNFQIAKSVATGSGKLEYNVIWQSKGIAPNTDISWTTNYALNWTADVPAKGMTVRLSGSWQPCAPGQVYDLDVEGFWAKSSVSPDPNFLNVGKVNRNPDLDGIHIVVGIQNGDGSFDAIFCDTTALSPGDSAKYQPKESVMWWYQTGMRNATMIDGADTATTSMDFTNANPDTGLYHYWTTYNCQSGDWVTTANPPPSTLYAPPTEAVGAESNAARIYVNLPSWLQAIFQIAVGSGKQASAAASLKSLLEVKYGNVEVKFIDDLHLKVQLGTVKRAKPNSNDSFAVVLEDAETDVSDCLKVVYDDGELPDGESWVVDYASTY